MQHERRWQIVIYVQSYEFAVRLLNRNLQFKYLLLKIDEITYNWFICIIFLVVNGVTRSWFCIDSGYVSAEKSLGATCIVISNINSYKICKNNCSQKMISEILQYFDLETAAVLSLHKKFKLCAVRIALALLWFGNGKCSDKSLSCRDKSQNHC